jgi:geranylgeranyl reductase
VHCGLGSRRLEQDWPLMMTIDRPAWIAGRVDELRDLGCEVRLGTRFHGWRADGGIALLDGGPLPCGSLVGADGAASRVRRGLGLCPGLVVRAFQLTVPATEAGAARLAGRGPSVRFDPLRFGAGYGWAFPAADEVRIGVGASSAFLPRGALKRAFFSWLLRLGLDRRRGRLEAGTIGCGYLGHRFGPVLLAGDAAGLASPVTGEGIRQALLSGREVAREVTEPGYRSEAIATLSAAHRRVHDVLARRFLGPPLFALAPALLGLPWIERAALERFAVPG